MVKETHLCKLLNIRVAKCPLRLYYRKFCIIHLSLTESCNIKWERSVCIKPNTYLPVFSTEK